MDQISSWSAQRPHSMSIEPQYIPATSGGESNLQMLYTMQNQEVIQIMNGSLDPHYNKQPLSPRYTNSLTSETIRRDLSFFNSDRHSPSELETDSMILAEQQSPTSDGSRSSHSTSLLESGDKVINRRLQNRAAQRRFRERRSEQNKVLQGQLSELNEKHQDLAEEFSKKIEEVSQLKTENEKLQTEIQTLRQRWQSMILLLQRPKSLQLLSMLIGDENAPGDSGAVSQSTIQDLDRYLPCLDALTSPRERP
ncbi:hypothetical protein PDE_02064 [Penicillium oxalicum 114-2]|uniref:BZIP domain-containing protein n=1 Tax=Penicillium oxalicum (strain 114-2 / CGMCC 5302) TaxID=933388 RepID=S8AYR3_PENO1|nr:hypothetical protein PDE_02064 [Penicillium oxalicum 114-2]